MANMLRVRAVGTGWTGGPGLSQFYFNPGATTIDAAMATNVTGRVRAYFDGMKSATNAAVGWQVDPVVAIIDDATGNTISEQVAGVSPSVVVGTAPTSLGPSSIAAVGLLKTGVFSSGRRIQGRTFYSPLASTFTDSTGIEGGLQTLQVTALTALNTTGGGPILVVWKRPKRNPTTHAITAPGSMAGVLSVASSGQFGIIKSRR